MKKIYLVFFSTIFSLQSLRGESCTIAGPRDYDELDGLVAGCSFTNPAEADTVIITGTWSTDGNNQSQGDGSYVLQIGEGEGGSSGTLLIQNNTTNFNGSIKVKNGGTLDLVAKMTLPSGAGLAIEAGGTLLTNDGGNDRITIGGNVIIKGTGCNEAIEGNSPPYCANGSGVTGPIGFDENGIDTDNVLPIVLGAFDAIPANNVVALEWETITEENFDYFSIERSENGLTFDEIGTVSGNGNSNERIQYSFEDENPLFGTSFYRLNAIDYDGSYEKFQILAVEYLPEDLQVLVYPNPANTQNIRLSLGMQKDTQLKKVSIFDLSGNHILDQNLKIGNNTLNLESRLNAGVYFAKVQIDNYQITRKLIIK